METIKLTYQDFFDNNKEKVLEFSKDLLEEEVKSSSLFALKVNGESMQPVINNKALVVADLSQKNLIDESIYLIYYDNKLWIKKYKEKTNTFISINKAFKHLVYKKEDIHLVAKVLLTFTTFS